MKLLNANLSELFTAANQACTENASTRDFEPTFAVLLDYIETNIARREEAKAAVLSALHDDSVAPELLAYLMHELRWPEVKQAITDRIALESDWRIKTPLSHVLEAFDDDWADADMYLRWQSTKNAD